MNDKAKKALVFGIPVLLVLIQLWPVDRSNPPVTREIRWATSEAGDIARRACYDCHSNETDWPWYAYVAPVSWWISDHVEHARGHLNFSEWDQPNDDADEIVEMVEEGEMPLPPYAQMHGEARLTGQEKEAFIQGVRATLEADPPVGEEGAEEGGSSP